MGKHKYGDRILVKDSVVDLFVERIFINETPNRLAVCVKVNQEKLFEEGEGFDTEEWQFHKTIPKEIFVEYAYNTFPLDNSGMLIKKSEPDRRFIVVVESKNAGFFLGATGIFVDWSTLLSNYYWLQKDGTKTICGIKKDEK